MVFIHHFSVSIWTGSYFPENRVCKCVNYLHTAQFSLRHSTRVFAKHTSIQFSSSVLFSNSKQKKQGYPLIFLFIHPLLICPYPYSSACDSGSYFPENRVCKCANYLHTAQFSLRHSTRVFAKHTSIQFSSSVLFSNSKQKKQGYPLPLSQLKSLKYVEQQLILTPCTPFK